MPLTNRFALFIVDIFVGIFLFSTILYIMHGLAPQFSENHNSLGDILLKIDPRPLTVHLILATLYWTAIDYFSVFKQVRETKIIYANTSNEISLTYLLIRSILKCLAISVWPLVAFYAFTSNDQKIIYDHILKIKRVQI